MDGFRSSRELGEPDPGPRILVTGDSWHWNPTGHRLPGEALAAFLHERLGESLEIPPEPEEFVATPWTRSGAERCHDGVNEPASGQLYGASASPQRQHTARSAP